MATDLPDPPADTTSTRLAGFGLTALGGLLIGVGALLPWVRSSLEGLPDASSPTYLGVDLAEGLVALASAVVVLGGLAVTRLAASPRTRRAAAGAVVAASLVAIGVAGATVISATDRFEANAIEDIISELDPSGNATDEQVTQVESLIEIRLAPGPFAVIGGGIAGAVGGVLLLAWDRRNGEGDRV